MIFKGRYTPSPSCILLNLCFGHVAKIAQTSLACQEHMLNEANQALKQRVSPILPQLHKMHFTGHSSTLFARIFGLLQSSVCPRMAPFLTGAVIFSNSVFHIHVVLDMNRFQELTYSVLLSDS